MVTRQPVHQLVQPGCSAAFRVGATGTTPLGYQWRKDGVALSGQTNPSLTLASVQTNDLGNYSVVVSNLLGSVTSSNAILAWNHPPVAMPDVVQRFGAGGVRIKPSDLTANDTDEDGDGLAVIGVSTTSSAGGIVGLNGGWIFYQPPPGFTNVDTFSYTVADGNCYGWSVGTVSVQIREDNTPISRLTIENVGNGSLRVSLDGMPKAIYRLQASPALPATNWQDVATGAADSFGVFEYFYQPSTNAPARFYRAVWP
jgi:hypothetical protein